MPCNCFDDRELAYLREVIESQDAWLFFVHHSTEDAQIDKAIGEFKEKLKEV